jgi:hypothetical protein
MVIVGDSRRADRFPTLATPKEKLQMKLAAHFHSNIALHFHKKINHISHHEDTKFTE